MHKSTRGNDDIRKNIQKLNENLKKTKEKKEEMENSFKNNLELLRLETTRKEGRSINSEKQYRLCLMWSQIIKNSSFVYNCTEFVTAR